jgi:hypothetical protein
VYRIDKMRKRIEARALADGILFDRSGRRWRRALRRRLATAPA